MRSASYAEQVLVTEIQRLNEDLEVQRKIDLQIIAEKQQLKHELSLAEEGLANYAQENEQMCRTLAEILEELRLGDSRHDLQAKIIATPGFSEHPSAPQAAKE